MFVEMSIEIYIPGEELLLVERTIPVSIRDVLVMMTRQKNTGMQQMEC